MLKLGALLYQCSLQGGVILLEGNLGVGKTTLVRGFLKAAKVSQSIRSPTYTLMEHYSTQKFNVIHMDLYRLSDPEELEYLAVRELLITDNLFLIEWPEKAQGFFTQTDVKITIEYDSAGRKTNFEAHSKKGRTLINCLSQ